VQRLPDGRDSREERLLLAEQLSSGLPEVDVDDIPDAARSR
jgi:hypothetical protein